MPRRFPRPIHPLLPLLLLGTALLMLAAHLLGGFSPAGSGGVPAAPTGMGNSAALWDGETGAVGAPITCVVIDPGHGGEDGGAVSGGGLVEKDLNLAVALYLRELLEAAGVPVVMTRTEDRLLYDRGVDYRGRKKMLDLAARRAVAEQTAGCLFVSIHMNAFTDPRYGGMQTWYGTADPRSREVAHEIRLASVALLPHNTRRPKAADRGIYLLDRLTCPAVLVECGFLTNPAEAARLGNEAYRRGVAAVIFSGIMAALGEGSAAGSASDTASETAAEPAAEPAAETAAETTVKAAEGE